METQHGKKQTNLVCKKAVKVAIWSLPVFCGDGHAATITFISKDTRSTQLDSIILCLNCAETYLQHVTMLQTCLIWDRDTLRHRECPAAQLPQVHSDTQEGPPCWASQLAVTSGDGIWDCKQVRSYGVQTCTKMLQTCYKHYIIWVNSRPAR